MITFTRMAIIVCALALSGCTSHSRMDEAFSWERIDDLFTLPLNEDAAKWYPDDQWTIEDVHVYVNLEIADRATRNFLIDDEKYRNGTCLLAAERKYEIALDNGFNEKDLEIVVIKLSEDAALNADWSNGWPTHAVLRHKNQVYDNGFISELPFELAELTTPRYGEQVKDVWSRYQK